MSEDKKPNQANVPDAQYGVQGSPELGKVNGDLGFGARHWGHGEYQGQDEKPASLSNDPKFATPERTYAEVSGDETRPDANILEDCQSCASRRTDVDWTKIEMSVRDGIVTLKGSAPSRQIKRIVEDTIDHIMGIHDVQNQLRILR